MDDTKKVARQMLLKIMEKALKHSTFNVPQPLPLVEEKAAKRLSTDDYIAWKQMLKEWEKVSAEGKKEISKLLVLNSYDVVEGVEVGHSIMQEIKDTAEYLKKHPEFEKSEEEVRAESMLDDFRDLLDD